ncbi:hypothetical protein [Pseudonocardia oceani]|uniref:Uncharacterized protein n=1 Tax=Pseudonocardia oceani TaxID=2792013 RepID=A0ABS6UH04_9PSEU|nr:hypothetical protein [Pseudonocardia oceani]MBW0088254.1 hypothetical protein [Pseudonocardia oceani]MBW0131203.1 hypothetical protein [Pseudonocardia oceani]MBW0132630.1 hypothetical protein [Pseudonocardia oceani]
MWRDHVGLWRYSVPFAFDLVHGAAVTWRAAYARTRQLVAEGPQWLPEETTRMHTVRQP